MEATPKDVLNQAEPLLPPFVNTERCRAFYWTGVKGSDAPIAYTVRAGNANGWQWNVSGQITGSARSWFRVEIPEGHWDEYHLEVRSATPRLVYSLLIGSQGYWKE